MAKVWTMIAIVLLLAACSFVVKDTRTPEQKSAHEATVTAQANLVPTVTSAPPVPTIEPQVVPEEEIGEAVPEPTLPPPCENIKGNISSSGEKIYHVEGQANYKQVKIDESKGEKWFCSEEEAKAAGWRKAKH